MKVTSRKEANTKTGQYLERSQKVSEPCATLQLRFIVFRVVSVFLLVLFRSEGFFVCSSLTAYTWNDNTRVFKYEAESD